jgi:hypothetical protein
VENSPKVIATPELMARIAECLECDVDDLTVGRVPLSWFGAVFEDGTIVLNKEDAIHALAHYGEVDYETLLDILDSLTPVGKGYPQPAVYDDDPDLLRLIDALQRMPRYRLARLLRGIDQPPAGGKEK